jgi:hypothetical protein
VVVRPSPTRAVVNARALAVLGLVLSLLDCRSKPRQAVVPVAAKATPSPLQVHPGDAIAIEYRWGVGPGAPRIEKGFGAFVHFVDPSGTLIFTDDHLPAPPPEAWEGGQTYTYKRVVLVPDLASPGPLEIRMGLFSTGGQRLALSGAGARRGYAPESTPAASWRSSHGRIGRRWSGGRVSIRPKPLRGIPSQRDAGCKKRARSPSGTAGRTWS